MRLIDADNIQDQLATLILYAAGTPEGECVEYAHALVDAEPTVEAAPVVHAHWEKADSRFHRRLMQCSNCKNFLDMEGVNCGRGSANYCPNCGARMDGGKDEED